MIVDSYVTIPWSMRKFTSNSSRNSDIIFNSSSDNLGVGKYFTVHYGMQFVCGCILLTLNDISYTNIE